MTSRNATALAMVAAAGMATSAFARPNFPEIEPNETKAQALANGAFTLAAGDSVSGTTTGTSTTVAGAASADTFLIRTGALPVGIYRHRLVLTTTGTTGHAGTIRGLTQTAGAPVAGSDAAFQTSFTTSTPARMNQWYGFGAGEQIYYRVTGVAATTANYTATLVTDPVTPTPIIPLAGSFASGQIIISTVGATTTDTDFWVYDSNFNAIPGYGNDDESILGGGTGATLQSLLKRNYNPGTYYIAMTNFSFGNNLGAPIDDDFRTGALLDFPGGAANSSTSTNLNVSFAVTDSAGTTAVSSTRPTPYDIMWFSMTVTGAPVPTGGCCLPSGCTIVDSLTCTNILGGTYGGDNTTCAVACPEGACCLTNGTCVQLIQVACTSQAGFWTSGATCAAACPAGACCLLDGTCADINQFGCTSQGGTWTAGATCGTIVCVPPGACCLPDGSCVILNSALCIGQGGTYQGDGTNCATNNCFVAPVLWDNGPLATGTVAGNGTVAPAGFQWSECADDGTTSCANTNAGLTSTQASFRLADDFTIAAPNGWNVTKVNVYAYVSGSTATTSPFTAAGGTLKIWNGRPSDATSTVVFGDGTTNRLGVSSDPTLYRIFNTTTPPPGTATGTTRRLWRNEMTVGTFLPPGTYWIDFGTSAASFAPTNTHKDLRGSYFCNALQQAVATGLWADAIDAGNPGGCADFKHDLPFEVIGSVVTPPTACYANCDNSTLPPCLNVNDFNCFLNAYSAGDPYANCDSSTLPPILNVNDFQCFLNAYSASCADPCAAH